MIKKVLVCGFSCLAFWSMSAQASDTWPMFQQNPSHTGYIAVNLDASKFQHRWTKSVAKEGLNPVTVAQGLVFASGTGYFSNNVLKVLNAPGGKVRWSVEYPGAFSTNPPSYDDGKVYIQTGNHSDDTYLHAYNANTGVLEFRSPHAAQWERYYSPTIYDKKVYVNGGYYGGMYGFDGQTGSQLWFASLQQYDEWTPAVDENYTYAYVGEYSPGLYVLNRATGAQAFNIPDANFSWNGWSMDLAPVLGGLNDVFAIHNGRLIRFDLKGKAISWERNDSFTGQPSIHDNTVYAIRAGALTAVGQRTGTSRWTWAAPSAAILSGPIIVTNTHLFVSSNQAVHCVDLKTRQQVWSYPATGKLTLGEGSLYIASTNGSLTAISLGLQDVHAKTPRTFGNVAIGSSKSIPVSVTNVGTASLQVNGISSSNPAFVVQPHAFPQILAAGGKMTATVTWNPVTAGDYSGALVIQSNDPNEPAFNVQLSGTAQ